MTSMEARQAQQRAQVEFAARAAETFASAYFAATDSPQRTTIIPTLYLADSSIVWNGNPISGAGELAQLLTSMPGSKHELQALDCQPLGAAASAPPSLLLTISGIVSHHTPTSLSALPPSNAPRSATGKGSAADGSDASTPYEALPRAFHQTMILVHSPDPAREGGINCGAPDGGPPSRYFVQSDTYRFVG